MKDQVSSDEEIVFHVEQADEGGFVAQAIGESIFTLVDSLEELRAAVREAVTCHFGNASPQRTVRLRFGREEVL